MYERLEVTTESKGTVDGPIQQFDYVERECGECSMCCQGYLYGEAYGLPFFPNNPCHYWDPSSKCGGCSIHKDRPAICSDFECLWKQTKQMPQWMKPDYCKVLIYNRAWQDVEGEYFEAGTVLNWVSAVECGQKMDSNVLSWLIQQARRNEWNLHYQINKQDHYLGSEQFHHWVNATAGQQTTVVYNERGEQVN
jgi:hypothetical protein